MFIKAQKNINQRINAQKLKVIASLSKIVLWSNFNNGDVFDTCSVEEEEKPFIAVIVIGQTESILSSWGAEISQLRRFDVDV